MANASYNFSINDFPYKKANLERLKEEVSVLPAALISIQPYKSNNVLWLKFTFDAALSSANQIVLRNIIGAHVDDDHHLQTQKVLKFVLIDTKTRALIAQGFPFNGVQFSLTDNAQKTLLGLDQLRDDPNMTYPVRYNSLDDTTDIELANSAMVHGFFLTAMGAFRAAWDSGTVQKKLVRAMTNVDDVRNYVDPR